MRQSELYKLLRSTGLEVYFYEADQNPTLPYIVYLKDGETAWGSDGRNFLRKGSYLVEFYSARKDFAIEVKLPPCKSPGPMMPEGKTMLAFNPRSAAAKTNSVAVALLLA